MINKDLEYYADVVKEAIADDKDRDTLYKEIDIHTGGKWEPPKAIKDLPWIKGRKFSSTKPADAVDSGARTFATLLPKVSISPLSDDPREYGRVEQLETALDWEFCRMNMGGGKSTHWKILESAMKYCAVAFQTEYLPHTLKGRDKDPFVKELLRQSKFQWPVHHPGTVHSRRTKNVLTLVCLATTKTAKETMEEFGEENEGVQKMLEMIKQNGKLTAESFKRKFSFYDVTDWQNRAIWIKDNNNSMQVSDQPEKGIQLRLEEHKLPFIPWVVVDNEDPILKNSIESGLLDNLNILRTIEFSKAVELAARSHLDIETPDGSLDGVSIEGKHPGQPISHGPAVKVKELRGEPIDPQLASMRQTAESEVSASSVTQVLSDASALESRNFSTANIKYRTAIAQLSLAKTAASRAEELGFYQIFCWLDYAKDKPLVAIRDKTKTFRGQELPAGQKITISPDEEMADAETFDLEHLYIKVELQEDSLLDEQSKWNIGTTKIDRFGMSRRIVAEELGVENYSLHELQRGAEELVLAQVQAQAKKIMGEADAYAAELMSQVQIKTQQMMMELQKANQPPQQPQGQPMPEPQNAVQGMNAGGSFATLQGADMRGGSMPAMQVAPGEGREQMNGTDMTGAPLA